MSKQPSVKGVVLYPDGTYTEQVFNNITDYNNAVGGYIEILHLKGASAYINENGKSLDLELNDQATLVALLSGCISYWDNIKGNMIILGTDNGEGYDTDISDYWLATVKNFWQPKIEESASK